MSNTYYKMLNQKMLDKSRNEIISDLHRDLSESIKQMNDNLYDFLASRNNLDINTLLKYYTINQLLKENPQNSFDDEKNEDFEDTANPKIKKNTNDNYYYRLAKNGALSIDTSITAVFEDGTYEKTKKINLSSYRLKTVYSTEDKVLSVQLIEPNETVVQNKQLAADLLHMRKEFVQKFKYSGYSGNSLDIIAAVKNKLVAPIESGYYMDNHFHFFYWNDKEKKFIRNMQFELHSPMLTDYVFKNEKQVVRKEYIGR